MFVILFPFSYTRAGDVIWFLKLSKSCTYIKNISDKIILLRKNGNIQYDKVFVHWLILGDDFQLLKL